jgi:hypothetical protein
MNHEQTQEQAPFAHPLGFSNVLHAQNTPGLCDFGCRPLHLSLAAALLGQFDQTIVDAFGVAASAELRIRQASPNLSQFLLMRAAERSSLSCSPHCRFTFLVHSYFLGQVEAKRKPAVRFASYQGYEFIST